ncbi:MAG: hypothetical protein GY718_11305, partial [Lentisphaerae bacterium]|nr:hypothetical protein [Lentisphaerota bacterium]
MWKVEGVHSVYGKTDAWFKRFYDAEMYANYIRKLEWNKTEIREDVLNAEVCSLQQEVYTTAVKKGWHDRKSTFGDFIALCHSELSAALEEYRAIGNVSAVSYENDCDTGKPIGVPAELANVILRILSFCGSYKID